jgi:hypothetical protein
MSRFKELTLSNEEKVTVNLEKVRYMEWVGTSTTIHFGTKHALSVKESPTEIIGCGVAPAWP